MALSGEYAGSNDVAAHGEADEEEEEGEHSWALPDNFRQGRRPPPPAECPPPGAAAAPPRALWCCLLAFDLCLTK